MFSRFGIETIQYYSCFTVNKDDARPPWVRPKPTTALNPERMNRGITRKDFEELQGNQEEKSESDDEMQEESIISFDLLQQLTGKGKHAPENL